MAASIPFEFNHGDLLYSARKLKNNQKITLSHDTCFNQSWRKFRRSYARFTL